MALLTKHLFLFANCIAITEMNFDTFAVTVLCDTFFVALKYVKCNNRYND